MKLEDAIKTRKTAKIIADTASPLQPKSIAPAVVDELLATAGRAPCHYACDRSHMEQMSSPVPWRVYKFDAASCRNAMKALLDSGDTTKIPNMLAAADFLLQVTWLPDAGTIINASAGKEETVFDGTQRNMEHIAAASTFVQNVLLSATAAGFQSYWSSGGPLRHWNVPKTEILLGSIFLYPMDVGNADIRAGSMAEKRGSVSDWSQWISVSE